MREALVFFFPDRFWSLIFVGLLTSENVEKKKTRKGDPKTKNKSKKKTHGEQHVQKVVHVYSMIVLLFMLPPSLSWSILTPHHGAKGRFSMDFRIFSVRVLQTWTCRHRLSHSFVYSEAPKIGHMVYMEATSVSSSSFF